MMANNIRSSNKILMQAAIILFFFWVVALVLLTRPLGNGMAGELSSDTLQRLSKAVSELESLKQRNHELRWILTNFSHEVMSGKVKEDVMEKLRVTIEDKVGMPINLGRFKQNTNEPSKEYEVKQRQIFRGVQELSYFFNHELETLRKKANELSQSELNHLADEILTSGKEHEMYFDFFISNVMHLYTDLYRILLNDVEELSNMEGHDAWRAAESRALSDLVQKRLYYLQNPADCSKAKKLICNLNKVLLRLFYLRTSI